MILEMSIESGELLFIYFTGIQNTHFHFHIHFSIFLFWSATYSVIRNERHHSHWQCPLSWPSISQSNNDILCSCYFIILNHQSDVRKHSNSLLLISFHSRCVINQSVKIVGKKSKCFNGFDGFSRLSAAQLYRMISSMNIHLVYLTSGETDMPEYWVVAHVQVSCACARIAFSVCIVQPRWW